jgi:hypothetical protein
LRSSSIASREIGFFARGTDAYAGYCMAGASFLALAHTLKRGEHIRVTLILQHAGAKARHGLEIVCHVAGFFLSGALAWFSLRLVWQSYTFHDISQGNDATPLWMPQICMAAGAACCSSRWPMTWFCCCADKNSPSPRPMPSRPASNSGRE